MPQATFRSSVRRTCVGRADFLADKCPRRASLLRPSSATDSVPARTLQPVARPTAPRVNKAGTVAGFLPQTQQRLVLLEVVRPTANFHNVRCFRRTQLPDDVHIVDSLFLGHHPVPAAGWAAAVGQPPEVVSRVRDCLEPWQPEFTFLNRCKVNDATECQLVAAAISFILGSESHLASSGHPEPFVAIQPRPQFSSRSVSQTDPTLTLKPAANGHAGYQPS